MFGPRKSRCVDCIWQICSKRFDFFFDRFRELYGAPAKHCSGPENCDASISSCKHGATQCNFRSFLSTWAWVGLAGLARLPNGAGWAELADALGNTIHSEENSLGVATCLVRHFSDRTFGRLRPILGAAAAPQVWQPRRAHGGQRQQGLRRRRLVSRTFAIFNSSQSDGYTKNVELSLILVKVIYCH